VLAAARTVPGVAEAVATERGGQLVAIDVVLTAEPGTPASYDTIRELRRAVRAVPAADAIVGGTVATTSTAATPRFEACAPWHRSCSESCSSY
jgi:hypothetical protein